MSKHDRCARERCGRLASVMRTQSFGYDGDGRPEPLRHMLAGAWSGRISEGHRLVYLVDGDDLVILQARFHYK